MAGGSRLVLVVLALLLGLLAPVHAGGPPASVADDQAAIQLPAVAQPPVVQVFLVAYRSQGPPEANGSESYIVAAMEGQSGSTWRLFVVVPQGHPHSAAAGQGRFWTMDDYPGSEFAPQSLHKYAYCGASPVGRYDPTGMFTQAGGYSAEDQIQNIYRIDHLGHLVTYGNNMWTSLTTYLRPDIQNHTKGTFAEIKPFSVSGWARGFLQWSVYCAEFMPQYTPDWSWAPSQRIINVDGLPAYVFNVSGLVFYTDAVQFSGELAAIGTVWQLKSWISRNPGVLQRLEGRLVPALSRMITRAVAFNSAASSTRLEGAFGTAALFSVMTFGLL